MLKYRTKTQNQKRPEYEKLKIKTDIFPQDQLVSVDAIYRVFHHGEKQFGDTHRFVNIEESDDFLSYV